MIGIGAGVGVPFVNKGGGPSVNNDFVIEVDTTQAGSASDTIILPLESGGTYSGTIDWGDSSTSSLSYANRQHTYAAGGTYTITISGDTFEGWRVANSGDKLKFIDIQNWGFFTISSSDRQFDYCQNLNVTATDAPTITTTSFYSIFRNCDALTTPDFSGWDTSTVTNMSEAFNGCALFNGNVQNWVHSGVTNCSRMMSGLGTFNQDLDTWDVSGVTGIGFQEMFRGSSAFNGDISGWTLNANPTQMFHSCSSFTGIGLSSWDVSGIIQLGSTFLNCSVLNADLSSWDVGNVTSFANCFYGCTIFNQNIGAWDMSSATNLSNMFFTARAFNNGGSDTIGNWDVSSVTTMQGTFQNADNFNQDIDGWTTTSLTNMSYTFAGTDSLTYSLNSWDTSNVTNFNSTFRDGNYNQNISSWDTSSATTMARMFQSNQSFNQPIGSWDTSSCLNFLYILYDADAFDQDISGWTVSQATNLQGMMQNTSPSLSTANYDALLIAWDAQGAMAYSGGAANFGVSQYSCRAASAHSSLTTKWGGLTDGGLDTSINCDFVSTWDTTQAGSASDTVELPLLSGGTYSGTIDWGDSTTSSLSYSNRTHTYASSGTYTITITGTIEGWQFNNGGDRRKITDISNWGNLTITTNSAFYGCTNLDVSATDSPTLSTTSLQSTFTNSTSLTTYSFDNWDTSGVTSLRSMFQGCTNFNGNVDNLCHSGVTDAYRFALNCSTFDQDLDTWDVSGLTGSQGGSELLKNATSFNGDTSGWTLGATRFDESFSGCSALTGIGMDTWNTGNCTSMAVMFSNCTLLSFDVSGWDVSSVTSFQGMFTNCNYNFDVGGWTTTSATNMASIMQGNALFNRDISSWDVSGVTTFYRAFLNCTAFDQDLSTLAISATTTNIREMFKNCSNIDFDASGWTVTGVTNATQFMSGCTLSTANYDDTLVGWEANLQAAYPNGSGYTATISIHFGGSQYSSALMNVGQARYNLVNVFGWTITDGGAV
jgi:surface protein